MFLQLSFWPRLVVVPPTVSNLQRVAGQKLHFITALGIGSCLHSGILGCYHHSLEECQEVLKACSHFSPSMLRGEPWQTGKKRGPVMGKALNSCVCQPSYLPWAGCCLVQGGVCGADKSTVAVLVVPLLCCSVLCCSHGIWWFMNMCRLLLCWGVIRYSLITAMLFLPKRRVRPIQICWEGSLASLHM